MNRIVPFVLLFMYACPHLLAQENESPVVLTNLNPRHQLYRGTPMAYLADQYPQLVVRSVKSSWMISPFTMQGIGRNTKGWYRLEVKGTYSWEDSFYTNYKMIKLADSTGNRIWQEFKSQELFSLKTQSDVPHPPCGYAIFDAGTAVIEIVVDGKYKRIEYDAPEFYESRCPVLTERTRFLRCFRIFDTIPGK